MSFFKNVVKTGIVVGAYALQMEKERKERKKKEEEAQRLRKIQEENARLKREQEAQKEKERKRIEEEKKRNEEMKNKLENAKQSIITTEKKTIENSFNNNHKNYLESHINEIFNSTQYQNFIQKVLNIESIKKVKEKKIDDIYKENFKDINENKKYKILLLGKTGVGKSTLINSIFGKELANTGLGEICTKFQIPKPYTNDNEPSLVLYDSRGIEIDEENGENALIERINNFIEERKEDVDQRIDCLWYCFTGERLENNEIKFLEKLKGTYYGKFPFIMVYTQSISEEDEKENKKVVEELMDKNILFVPVVAKDIKMRNNKVVEKFGLPELLNITKNEIDKNIKHLNFVFTMKKVDKYIENLCNEDYLNKNENVIKQLLNENLNPKIQEISTNGLNEYINNKVKNLINMIKAKESEIKKSYQNSGNNTLDYNNIEGNVKNELKQKMEKDALNYSTNFVREKVYDKVKIIIKENMNNVFRENKEQFIKKENETIK